MEKGHVINLVREGKSYKGKQCYNLKFTQIKATKIVN